MEKIKFNELITQAAGPELGWMVKALKEVGELHDLRGLAHIGYNCCWEDEAFTRTALSSAGDLLKEVLPNAFATCALEPLCVGGR